MKKGFFIGGVILNTFALVVFAFNAICLVQSLILIFEGTIEVLALIALLPLIFVLSFFQLGCAVPGIILSGFVFKSTSIAFRVIAIILFVLTIISVIALIFMFALLFIV